MRRVVRFQLLLSVLCLFRGVPARAAEPVDAKDVDAIVVEAMKAWGAPGVAVAIVRDGEVVYLKGHGVRALGSDQPVTPDTVFAIASTSKAFTAAAVGLLVDDGKMSWDDPVRKHLPGFRLADPTAGENVTLRDLLCHRTGLSRNDLLWYRSPWDRAEVLQKIGQIKLTQTYRYMFQYQNIMFLAAGQAVGAASGSSWEAFTKKRIFEPLGMTGASFSATDALKAPDHATPHLKPKDGPVKSIAWLAFENVGPAGSINCGIRDLSKWVRFQLGDGTFEGKRLMAAATLAEMHSPQMVIDQDGPTGVPSLSKAMNPETNLMTYGLGWIIQDYRGQLMISHGGSIDGFRAQVALLPKKKIGIVVLSNLGRNSLPEAVRNNLVDLLLDKKEKDWVKHYQDQARKQEERDKAREAEREAKRHKNTKPSRDLPAYVAGYEEAAYGTARISLEKDALVLHWSTFRVSLEHYHFDTFRVRDAGVDENHPLYDQRVTFTLDADGNVSRLNFVGQEFKRSTQAKR